jgi:LPS-assembly protein
MASSLLSTVSIAQIAPGATGQAESKAQGRKIACWDTSGEVGPLESILTEPIEMTSGDADIEADGTATFRGPIEMRSKSRSLRAGSANYDRELGIVTAEGDIEYSDPVNRIQANDVRYYTETGQFNFTEPRFEFSQVPARGSASELKLVEPGVVELDTVKYTSCPEGRDDWMLRASSIDIDTNTGMGTARNARLYFKGVPFFYWPYFTYPVTDDRKSGLLFPRVGSSDRRGFEYQQPIYWNIAPNQDATFTPHYMADRGVQLGTEYRFLTRSNGGVLYGDFLPDDDEAEFDRWRYEVETVSMLPGSWRGRISATGVSDDDYFEDLASSISKTSQTNLSRAGILEYYDLNWSVYGQVQDFQTIDPAIAPEDEPYTQVPQLVANGMWRNGWLGTQYGFDSEAAYFARDDSVKGLRTHVMPKLSRPFRYGGLYLVPEVAYDYTAYNLKDQPEDQSDTPDRGASIFSVDAGAVFERYAGKGGRRLFTVEPRALYTYIPEEDQDELPVFDTIEPDFNLIQLYRNNRFIGYDRLGDTNQIALGVTSRVLDTETGRELLTATIGQNRLLETGEITLPDEEPRGSRKSDYIAELDVRLWRNWNAAMRYQLDADERETERTSIRLRYRPAANKAINVGYRYDKETLEQTDISFAWPLSKTWSAIGRYNYSIEDSKVLDEYLGIEYSSCCWGVRVLARRTVARSTGDQDETIGIQFVMKGLSNIGSESTENLRRGILGY